MRAIARVLKRHYGRYLRAERSDQIRRLVGELAPELAPKKGRVTQGRDFASREKWRRGESNRPLREAGGRESSSPAELSRDYVPSSTASNL